MERSWLQIRERGLATTTGGGRDPGADPIPINQFPSPSYTIPDDCACWHLATGSAAVLTSCRLGGENGWSVSALGRRRGTMHINKQGDSLVMYYYAGADALVACLFCTALRCNCTASEGKGLCASTFGAVVRWPGEREETTTGLGCRLFSRRRTACYARKCSRVSEMLVRNMTNCPLWTGRNRCTNSQRQA